MVRSDKPFRVANFVLLAAMVLPISRMGGFDPGPYRGPLQHIFTLTNFPPIAGGAAVLISRLRRCSMHPKSTQIRLPISP